MLTLAQDDGRRIWVILDELPTLHQVPSLQPGLAESRQFGGCFVLGVQVASALRDLYGRNGAETISGLCGTRVVLAAPDRDTAQWSADSLGRSEVEEVAEGYSYGANTIRDGVSLTPRRELRALALPSEIMRLPNLHGYLKFPGPLPVASIRLKYVERPAAAERFVSREGDAGAAVPDDDGIAVPEHIDGDAEVLEIGDGGDVPCPGSDDANGAALPEDGPDAVPWQGELDLAPLPEATGDVKLGPVEEPASEAPAGAPAGGEDIPPEPAEPVPASEGDQAGSGDDPSDWA